MSAEPVTCGHHDKMSELRRPWLLGEGLQEDPSPHPCAPTSPYGLDTGSSDLACTQGECHLLAKESPGADAPRA